MTKQPPYGWQTRKCIQLLLILLCSLPMMHMFAQEPDIRYVQFTRNNFLATNQVNCIMQDSKKFYWIATSNGIQRFDGNRWLWLSQQKQTGTSLPDNDVTSIVEDQRQRLWVQTASGICILDRNNLEFKPVSVAWRPIHPVHTIQSLVSLPDGHVWLTLASGGLYYYDENAKQFIAADQIIPASTRLIYQIVYDSSNHQYYLGTDSGIVIYNIGRKEFYGSHFNPMGSILLSAAPARESIVALMLNSLGQLWFSSYNIHSGYDTKTGALIFCDSTSKTWGVLGYTTDRSGTTWSYGRGISKMNLASGKLEPLKQTPDQLYGISFQNAGCIMEDSENTYWIATTNGVFIYNRVQQQFFQHVVKSNASAEILNHVNVWGFAELADSSVVAFTTGQEGLYFFDQQLRQVPSRFNLQAYFNTQGHLNIRCGVTDKDQHLWVATERGVVLKLFPENGRVEKIDDTVLSKLGVYSMTIDSGGNLYFGTFRNAVMRRDAISGKFSTLVQMPSDQNGSDIMFRLLYDGNHSIWAATSRTGLLRINTETGGLEKTYVDDHSTLKLPGATVYSISKNSNGELMLATEGGITVMDISSEKFKLLNTADGLPDNNTAALIAGRNNELWFASDNGISSMKARTFTTTSYGLLEGLTNEEFNIDACTQLRDGRMLFGHNTGFTSFNPVAFGQHMGSSSVQVTGIRLFDKYLNLDSVLNDKRGLVLSYDQNFLTIEFSNMSLLNKNHTAYYYQLEGVDKDWIKTSGMPEAVYTYLPGGTYTFRVKCRTGSEKGPDRITAITIKIIPPIWKTWWFYLLTAMLVSGLIYLFLRTRYRQQLEAEKGRNRIAKDLHDDMGSSLSTINILSEMAKTKIETDIPLTKRFIHQISDNSNRIMESLDDIVWNIDTANDTMENTLSRMREFAGSLLEARDISYSFKVDDRIRDIHLELGRRHDFFMIFKEAVNNLAKYSDCKTVRIDLLLQKNMLRLVIADDGRGFDRQLQVEGNGLSNMQQRANALLGVLSIESEISKGTMVVLSFPA